MEKSRAIELLKLAVPIKALTQQEYADFVEAVNMGMDALEQPTSPDTIDRKAALDALRKCQTYLYDARDPELKIKLSSAKAAINNLPTIQPVATDTNVGDTISRQAAIDEITEYGSGNTIYMSVVELKRRIEQLPPAQSERQKGEWLADNRPGGGFWVCSCCKFPSEAFAANVLYKFCPNCGAKMKGEI